MEMYNGSQLRATETYMIPGTASNQHLTLSPPPQEIDPMGTELAPEFIVDQGIYYPVTAANYYGYYPGFESPSEWNDHQGFFGLDGHDLHYPGMQTESLPIVYYTPSYGYAHSPYNPYNPYIPGAFVGADSPIVGTQQYFTNSAFQQPASSPSPAYYPVVVQPGSDVVIDGSSDHFLSYTNASAVSRPGTACIEYAHQFTPAGATATVQKVDSGSLSVEPSQSIAHKNHSSSRSSIAQVNAAPSKQPALHGIVSSASASQVTQGRNSPASFQSSDNFPPGSVVSRRCPLKVTVPRHNGFTDYGSNVHGWTSTDKLKPRLFGVLNNGNGISDMLGEQNRGPRSRSKGQWTSSIVVKAYTTRAGALNSEGNIVIHPNQYNREDFPVNYPDAKFFVIKSYSEDDVHKSIKYNVWSSTPSGNKRLDSAYEEAQRISGGNPRKCPVFLFFSVNASGQFCGVAEMIGPVDFHKDMDFWQQDKWTGSFPVKWHVIKDVPNTSFRHIILENNENKPVTNSRDTQEIRFIPGISMLNIFKCSPMRTSILDDLMYYEERQRIVHEEKSRLLGRSYDAAPFVPAFVPPNRLAVTVKQPLKTHEKLRDVELKSSSVPSKTEKPRDVELNCSAVRIPCDDQVTTLETASKSPDKTVPKSNLAQDSEDVNSVLKIDSLSLKTKDSDADHSTTQAANVVTADVVTVGSVPIKVNGFAELPPGVLTVGTIPIDPKTVKQIKPSG